MDIFKLIHEASAEDASDLHLVVSSPPLFRILGSLRSANGTVPLTAEAINEEYKGRNHLGSCPY